MENTRLTVLICRLSTDDDMEYAEVADQLKEFFEKSIREKTLEHLKATMTELYKILYSFVHSSDKSRKKAGLRSIDELLTLLSSDEQFLAKSASFIQGVLLSENNGQEVTSLVIRVFGKLTRLGGPIEYVTAELKRAIDRISNKRKIKAIHRYSLLILQEICRNSPNIFYPNIPIIINQLWDFILDVDIETRECSVDTLKECFIVVKNKTHEEIPWFGYIYDQTLRGLKSPELPSLHGSLLVAGVIFDHAPDESNISFKELADRIFGLRNHRELVIKSIVIRVFSKVAKFSPSQYSRDYHHLWTAYLYTVLRDFPELDDAFLALGELAQILSSVISTENYKAIFKYIIDAIQTSKSTPTKALRCASMIVKSMKQSVTKFAEDFLMNLLTFFQLNDVTLATLTDISESLPELLAPIQERLLSHLSTMLSGRPLYCRCTLEECQIASRNSADAILALKALLAFNFSGLNLIDFLDINVIPFIDSPDCIMRRLSIRVLFKILVDCHLRQVNPMVEGFFSKILKLCIIDPDVESRLTILKGLTEKFDQYIFRDDFIQLFFICLNDEEEDSRSNALQIIQRITNSAPEMILPYLRSHVVQLLSSISCWNNDSKKDYAIHQLRELVHSCPTLLKEYSSNIYFLIEPLIKQTIESPDQMRNDIATSFLFLLGELTRINYESMVRHFEGIMPVIERSLLETSSSDRKKAALSLLGEMSQNEAFTIPLYFKYPEVFLNMFRILRSHSTNNELRAEAMRTSGRLGVIDPSIYKQVISTAQKDSYRSGETFASSEQISLEDISKIDDFILGATLDALGKIFYDPNLSTSYDSAMKAMKNIIRYAGKRIIPFLNKIIVPMLQLLPSLTSESKLSPPRLLSSLSKIILLVEDGSSSFLRCITDVIQRHWKDFDMFDIVKSLYVANTERFKAYIPALIPRLMESLISDTSEDRHISIAVVDTINFLYLELTYYGHLIIPYLVPTIQSAVPFPDLFDKCCLTLSLICRVMDLTKFSSYFIIPLLNIIGSSCRDSILDVLCSMVYSMKENFLLYLPSIQRSLTQSNIFCSRLDELIMALQRNIPLPSLTRPKLPESPKKLTLKDNYFHLNLEELEKSWSSKDDCTEWMRNITQEFLRQSPSPIIRSCFNLSSSHIPLQRELFNHIFLAMWVKVKDIPEASRGLIDSIRHVMTDPSCSLEILNTLLNMFEFMEKHECAITEINNIELVNLASRCAAHNKAVFYTEREFVNDPEGSIESLISTYNAINQPDAALGILNYVKTGQRVNVSEEWYMRLGRWEEALDIFEQKQIVNPMDIDATYGRMKCLIELGEYMKVMNISRYSWNLILTKRSDIKEEAAKIVLRSLWNLGKYDEMSTYVSETDQNTITGSFYRAILAIQKEEFGTALSMIDRCRQQLNPIIVPLIREDYGRAYSSLVTLQQLSELEEIIQYKQELKNTDRLERLKLSWNTKLMGCQRDVDVWDQTLAVRSLLFSKTEQLNLNLKYSSICMKQGRLWLTKNILLMLLSQSDSPQVIYSYSKYLWRSGDRGTAIRMIKNLVDNDALPPELILKANCRYCQYLIHNSEDEMDQETADLLLKLYSSCLRINSRSYVVWHYLGIFHFSFIKHNGSSNPFSIDPDLLKHILEACECFFKSVIISGESSSNHHQIQDMLKILTIWFDFGSHRDVFNSLKDGLNQASVNAWLSVVPQMIARINTTNTRIASLLKDVLLRLGMAHAPAMIYSLIVASSTTDSRSTTAKGILEELKRNPQQSIVEQAQIVSQELINVAIVSPELWYEGLEDAARAFFFDNDPTSMFKILLPLHEQLRKEANTMQEVAFKQAYGIQLEEARHWCEEYVKTPKKYFLDRAWSLYHRIYLQLKVQIATVKTVSLEYSAPVLLVSRNLDIVIPGHYDFQNKENNVYIAGFKNSLKVIPSKQRPRKIILIGSDGRDYGMLLKGHEDLRLDERVMQLFNLVNHILRNDNECCQRHLGIRRYEATPLSYNSGLVEWVDNTDTLHVLIKEYRDSYGIALSVEQMLILQFCPNFENSKLLQRVEAFEYAMDATSGQDLNRAFWMKAPTSEVWLERRTNFTRSLAVMSMVGYMLGLGDRHPSNLMLDRNTGNLCHIDFGDCFEVAMNRDKYPETVPFRLTRMLRQAMEVKGIEGSFLRCCDLVMSVLRSGSNKDSLMAMLEAFVYDPLFNWVLLTPPGVENKEAQEMEWEPKEEAQPKFSASIMRSSVMRSVIRSFSQNEFVQGGVNEKALLVINRVRDKLSGRDFPGQVLDVTSQVKKLIYEATSTENLCQLYIGWCPFW